MDVPLDPVGLSADNQTKFCVRLQSLDPVNHLHVLLVQKFCPFDVTRFVESGLQLDNHRDVLALLRGPRQGGYDGALAAGAVECLLDR